MFADTQVFYEIGRAVWAGNYIGLYPYPLAVIFSGLSVLPLPVMTTLLLFVSILIVVIIFKRKAWLWFLFTPLIFNILVGNLDVIALGLLTIGSPFSLAFLTLKPQLFIFAIPLLYKNRSWWKPFGITTALLWGIPTLFRPLWLIEWVRTILADSRLSAGASSSIVDAPLWLSLAVIALLLAIHADKFKGGSMAIFTALRPYDFTMLAGGSWLLVPLSWVAAAAMIYLHAEWPMGWLGIAHSVIMIASNRPASVTSNVKQRRIMISETL